MYWVFFLHKWEAIQKPIPSLALLDPFLLLFIVVIHLSPLIRFKQVWHFMKLKVVSHKSNLIFHCTIWDIHHLIRYFNLWKSSLSSETKTRFPLNASTFECLFPKRWTILKWKSCNIDIHLPFFPFASKSIISHFKGLWLICNKKNVWCKNYMKCIIPRISA